MRRGAKYEDPSLNRRTSTRVAQALPLTVTGVDVIGHAFVERTSTVNISCNGCRYQSKHYAKKDSVVTLEIPAPDPSQEPRRVQARVVWVQRPMAPRELFQVNVKLQVPGNVWGIAFPPPDWFPLPEEGSSPSEVPAVQQETSAEPAATPPVSPARDESWVPLDLELPEAARSESPSAPEQKEVTTQVPARPVPAAGDRSRVPVAAGEAGTPATMASVVERVSAETRKLLEKTAREVIAGVAEAETRRLLEALGAQLQGVAAKAVEAAAASYTDQTVRQAIVKIDEARRAAVGALKQEADQHLGPQVRQAQQAAQELAAAGQAAEAALRTQRERRSQEGQEAMGGAAARMRETFATLEKETVRQAIVKIDEARQAAADALKQEWRREFEDAVREADQHLGPQVRQARQAAQELAAAGQAAEAALRTQRERRNQEGQEAMEGAAPQMRETFAALEKEFEEKSHAALTTALEELDSKSTETNHTTFEALYKAAEWYQKKAQTSMQAAMDKALEQAGTALREKAGESSRLFASELDHHTRSYVEHARGLLEGNASEVLDGARAQLNQAAETITASLGDQIHQITGQTAAQLTEVSKIALAQTAAQLQALETQAELSVRQLRQSLASEREQQLAEAQKEFGQQLAALREVGRAQQEAEQRAWLEKLAQLAGESAEQYKQRLENIANTWMIAAVTTVTQRGQGAIQALAEAAEQRVRQTCAQAFADVAETFRQRLLGISAELHSAPPSGEKK